MNLAGLLHVNINCRDFDRSRAFYEKLGFRVLMPINQEEEGALAAAVGMRNYSLRGALMRSRDGTIIDLLEWQHPRNEESPYGALNHLGLARLAFVTKDLDADIAALEEEGVTSKSGTWGALPPSSQALRASLESSARPSFGASAR